MLAGVVVGVVVLRRHIAVPLCFTVVVKYFVIIVTCAVESAFSWRSCRMDATRQQRLGMRSLGPQNSFDLLASRRRPSFLFDLLADRVGALARA